MNQAAQLQEIENYTSHVLAADESGHSMDHIERVVRMAQRLAESVTCDHFLVSAGAYLHDVTDDKLVADVTNARQELLDFLLKIGLTESKCQRLFTIIDNVSFSNSIGKKECELSIEAQIVQDADRLDALGAIGIGRTFYYGGYKGHQMYDPQILPREIKTKAEYRHNETVINHFYEKLLLLPERLNLPLAKEIGRERQQVMELFLQAFKKEWQGL